MRTSVKLSDKLLKEARRGARASGRSIAGQIEHWARIGRSAEQYLPLPRHVVSFFEEISQAHMQAAVGEKLRVAMYPIYAADSERPGGIVEIRADGARVRGTWDFQRKVFVPRTGPGS